MNHSAAMLGSYLAKASASLDGPDIGPIVIGNEAADLDSMVSALLHGYLMSSCKGQDGSLAVPVVNCPRADFPLRTEAVYLFSALGVDVDTLVFVDDIDLEQLHRNGRLRLTLVDHNVLAADQAGYADAVAAIIDHHRDDGLYAAAQPRTIEPVGSTATLVAEAMLRDRPALIDAGTAMLLLGTILLDTVNLDPAAQRVTAKDRLVATRLGEIAGPDADGLFARLEAAKFDVAALSTGDLLRKDYKAWDTPSGKYGMSTVLTKLEDWIARDPDLVRGLDDFLRSRGLFCLVVMLAYTDTAGEFRRQLAVYVPDTKLAGDLAALLHAGHLELDRLRPSVSIESKQAMFFDQGNTSISRKKLQPLLHKQFADQGNG